MFTLFCNFYDFFNFSRNKWILTCNWMWIIILFYLKSIWYFASAVSYRYFISYWTLFRLLSTHLGVLKLIFKSVVKSVCWRRKTNFIRYYFIGQGLLLKLFNLRASRKFRLYFKVLFSHIWCSFMVRFKLYCSKLNTYVWLSFIGCDACCFLFNYFWVCFAFNEFWKSSRTKCVI